MEEIEFSRWLFEGRLRQCKNVLPDGLNWLCYFAGSSESHRENSISFIFLESPHQVNMKNVVKSSKHFFGYFNTLETHSELYLVSMYLIFFIVLSFKSLKFEIFFFTFLDNSGLFSMNCVVEFLYLCTVNF